MKKKLFLVISSLVLAGCSTVPRAGSIGHDTNAIPILTTNVVRMAAAQSGGGQSDVSQTFENSSVVSTQPVEKRTWTERAFGLRPPVQTQVVPPFPRTGGGNEYPNSPTTASYPYPYGVRQYGGYQQGFRYSGGAQISYGRPQYFKSKHQGGMGSQVSYGRPQYFKSQHQPVQR